MRILLLVLAFAFATAAQSISPLRAECKLHCRGEITVSNASVRPLAVVIEARQLARSGANLIAISPPSSTSVRLSAMSARLSPKSSETIEYEITCATIGPCAIVLNAVFTEGHVNSGIQARITLTSAVYLCATEKDCRKNTLAGLGVAVP